MKFYKGLLHFLITLVSAFAFLVGWASLAHSLKPVQPVEQESLAALDPLPPVGSFNAPFSSTSRPRARTTFVTRGS